MNDAVQKSVIPALSRNPVPGGCIQTGWLWQTGHSFSPYTAASRRIGIRECSDSTLQRFGLDSDGALVLAGTGLCMAVSPENGEPTGGPSHLRRDLFMLDCAETEPALGQWTFPGRSPE